MFDFYYAFALINEVNTITYVINTPTNSVLDYVGIFNLVLLLLGGYAIFTVIMDYVLYLYLYYTDYKSLTLVSNLANLSLRLKCISLLYVLSVFMYVHVDSIVSLDILFNNILNAPSFSIIMDIIDITVKGIYNSYNITLFSESHSPDTTGLPSGPPELPIDPTSDSPEDDDNDNDNNNDNNRDNNSNGEGVGGNNNEGGNDGSSDTSNQSNDSSEELPETRVGTLDECRQSVVAWQGYTHYKAAQTESCVDHMERNHTANAGTLTDDVNRSSLRLGQTVAGSMNADYCMSRLEEMSQDNPQDDPIRERHDDMRRHVTHVCWRVSLFHANHLQENDGNLPDNDNSSVSGSEQSEHSESTETNGDANSSDGDVD